MKGDCHVIFCEKTRQDARFTRARTNFFFFFGLVLFSLPSSYHNLPALRSCAEQNSDLNNSASTHAQEQEVIRLLHFNIDTSTTTWWKTNVPLYREWRACSFSSIWAADPYHWLAVKTFKLNQPQLLPGMSKTIHSQRTFTDLLPANECKGLMMIF